MTDETAIDPRPAFVLPHEIVVLGQRFHVGIVEHPTAALDPTEADTVEALGHCNRALQRITIRGGGALTEDKARETLLHEVLHAVIGTARIPPFSAESGHGEHDSEEAIVSMLAPLLLDTLRRNPELVAALISR